MLLRCFRWFALLILAGFLKVTTPSSIVLLLKLFKLLFVIGGGLAGGSFLTPRVRRSKKKEIKISSNSGATRSRTLIRNVAKILTERQIISFFNVLRAKNRF